jgi:hypothetical protein
LNLPPAPELNLENNPYKRLSAYDSNRRDARLFFVREELEAELVERVAAQPLTIVLGASGTSKSSLVKAGVLPRLAEWTKEEATAEPPDATDWPVVTDQWTILEPLRPMAHPLCCHWQCNLSNAVRKQLSTEYVRSASTIANPTGADLAAVEAAYRRPGFCSHPQQIELGVDGAAPNFPIFQLKRRDAPKFADIVCDKGKFTRQRRHCDHRSLPPMGVPCLSR